MVVPAFLMVFYWCKQRYIIIKKTLNHRCYLHPMTSTFTVFTWKSHAITIKLPSKQSPINYHQMTPVFLVKSHHITIKSLFKTGKHPIKITFFFTIVGKIPWPQHEITINLPRIFRSPQPPQSPFPGDPGYPTNCPKLVHWSRCSKSLLNKLLRSTR